MRRGLRWLIKGEAYQQEERAKWPVVRERERERWPAGREGKQVARSRWPDC